MKTISLKEFRNNPEKAIKDAKKEPVKITDSQGKKSAVIYRPLLKDDGTIV